MALPECTQKPIALGGGVENAEVRFLDGEPRGVYYEHPCIGGALAPSYIPIAYVPSQPRNDWRIERLDPLTLSPSLLCRACGHHGFIRDGKWVPA